MEYEELIDALEEAILDLEDEDLIELYNHTHSEQILRMDELDDFVVDNGYTATELIDMLSPDFSTDNEYFAINLANMFISFDQVRGLVGLDFNIEEIAEELAESGDTYNIPALEEVFRRFRRY